MDIINVGELSFSNKEELKDYARGILRSAKLNRYLTGETFYFVDCIFRMHYNYNRLCGTGTYKLGVRKCSLNPKNKQFFVKVGGKTAQEFSYLKAITSPSAVTRVKKALRDVVMNDSWKYKNIYFEVNSDSKGYVICPVTNLKIRKEDSHLDHYPKQFDEIVWEWLDIFGMSFEDAGDMIDSMNKGELLSDFRNFHLKVATYRVVLNKVNMQRPKAVTQCNVQCI